MGILLQSPVFYKVTASDILLGCSFFLTDTYCCYFSCHNCQPFFPARSVFVCPRRSCFVSIRRSVPSCAVLPLHPSDLRQLPFPGNDALTVSPGQQPESAPGSLHPKLRFEAVVSAPVLCHNAGRALIFLRRSGGLCYIPCRTCGKSD